MPTPMNDIHEDTECDDSESALPVVLATGSAVLLGYIFGRITYRRDLQAALRRIEESPEPITISIRTL